LYLWQVSLSPIPIISNFEYMRTVKKIFTSLALCLITVSCTNEKTQEAITKLNVVDQSKQIIAFDSVKMIPLDESSGQLFASIAKMSIVDNLIYIMDDLLSAVYIFDMDGKFISKFGNIGQGPGEIVRLGDMDVVNGKLYIYDAIMRRILCFNVKNNQHIKTISTPFFARAFSILENGDILFVLPKDQKHKQVVITDSLGHRIKKEYIDFNKEDPDNHTRYGLLQRTSQGITYSKSQTNTIRLFSKKDGTYITSYQIRINNNPIDPNVEDACILKTTPFVLKNFMLGNYVQEKKLFYFEIVRDKDSYATASRKWQGSNNNLSQLMLPMACIGDSVFASYLTEDIYETYDNHSIRLTSEMENHLKNGGYIISLYRIKQK
jgi:hypothetical protein